MKSNNEEMVPLKEAEHQVKVVTQRLALLHLAYAKTLVKEFGWEKGKLLVLKAIKNYGLRVADRTQRGFQSLPNYGFWETREGQPRLCELGKLMLESGEGDIGSLYCLIDAAKTMAMNPGEKLIHTKCLPLGDELCEFVTAPTTDQDRADFFAENRDWSHVDPRLGAFYDKKKVNAKTRERS